MKKVFFMASLAISVAAHALSYTISFTGSGASSSIDQVVVQNLTQSTSVTVPAGNVLNLTNVLTALPNESIGENGITLTQQAQGTSVLSFTTNQAGDAQLILYAIDGRKLAQTVQYLQAGSHSFQLVLPQGVYVIQLNGKGYAYTSKAISPSSNNNHLAQIIYCGIDEPITTAKLQHSKSTSVTTLGYNTGDQLLYKATAGNYSTIVTDVPTADKTTDFSFVDCTDADGNNYTAVSIGTQIWMVENLKSSKYRDGSSISNITDNTAWGALTTGAWCDYNNAAANENKYGKLYNWYALSDSRNIAPTGWHVASDAEWTTLLAYATTHFGSSLYTGKALAATTDWATYSDVTVAWNNQFIGNKLSINNSSGFSALPGGYRASNVSFGSLGLFGYWWSSTVFNTTKAWYFGMAYGGIDVSKISGNKSIGYSVRCVRD